MLLMKEQLRLLTKACVASAVCALLILGNPPLYAQDSSQTANSSLNEQSDDQQKNVAILRALDKITARITELQVPTGDEGVTFGNLLIKSPQCRSNPPEETPESFVLLTIDELKKNGQSERIFSGWMLASSPALNPLEHPVYDVWAINCRTVSGAGSE